MVGQVISVNVGRSKVIGTHRGNPVHSAIDKRAVEGRREVRGWLVDGDEQVDKRFHGGPDMVVYAYAQEDAAWWAQELGRDIHPGMFGENLTTAGVDCTSAVIGERWRVGTALLEVTQPREPCYKLGLQFGDPKMLKRFVKAERPGAYFRVIEAGEFGAGDAIEVVEQPDHGITIQRVSRAILIDRSLAPEVLAAPQLADSVRRTLAPRS